MITGCNGLVAFLDVQSVPCVFKFPYALSAWEPLDSDQDIILVKVG
jgi:hypothetical protein